MASFQKTAHGWRAFVWTLNERDSASFRTKGEASAWATEREAEIRAGKRGQIIPRTVRQALQRYAADVSPGKGGGRWERIRLAKLEAQLPFAGRLLAEVSANDIADWRDRAQRGELAPMLRKLKDGTTKVTPARALAAASVRREMVLLRSVLEIARREWGWLRTNPMAEVSLPAPGAARERRISQAEIDALCGVLGLADSTVAETVSARVALAFLFALETAMRAGEIAGLTWDRVHLAERFVELPKTKNGDARKVPLSKAAAALLERLPRRDGDEQAPAFHLTTASIDALFRKARGRAGIVGLTFHDSRHEAVTRLARKLDVLDLARMIGHRDLKSLRTYYNATASEIAARLD